MEKTKVLLIDDEARIRQAFARTLKLAGYAITTAENGEVGLATFDQEQPDIVLLDLRMPGMDGLTVLQEMRKRDPEANVILATGHGDKDAVIAALRAGASDFLGKPIDHVALESALRRAEERLDLKRKLRASEEALRQQNARLEDEVQARTAELQETLAKYQVLFNAFPLGISVSDATGQIVEANQESERLLGLSQQEHAQREIDGTEWRIIRPDGTPMPPEEYASVQALQEGQVVHNVEMGIVKGPDDVTWISVTAAPLQDDRVVITYNDITKRIRAERQIDDQRRHMQLAQEIARIGYWSFDVQTGVPTWSDMMFESLGCDPANGVPSYEAHRQFVYPDDWALFDTAVQEANQGTPYNIEMRVVFPDGSLHYVNAQGYPHTIVAGRVTKLFGITQDITARKRAEAALRESEARFKSLFAASPDAILLAEAETGVISHANAAAATLFEYPLDRLIGMQYHALHPPHQSEQAQAAFTYSPPHPDGAAPSVEIDIVTAQGETKTVEIRGRNIQIGGIAYVLGNFRDIIDRKRAEEACQQRKVLLAKAEQMAQLGSWVWDLKTGVFTMSEGWQQVHGCDSRQLTSELLLPIAHPDDRARVKEAFDQALEGQQPYDIEHRIIRQDNGKIRIIQAYGEVTRDTHGNPIKMYGAAHDITARKRAEAALRQSKERLSAILKYTPTIIYLKDLEGRFTLVNRAFERAFDVPRDAVLGKSSYDLVPAEMAEEHQAHDAQVIQSGSPYQFEETAIEADGQPHTALSIKFPMYDAEGTLIGIGGISSDITDRKQTQASLQRIEWLLNRSLDPAARRPAYTPPYGDVTELNTCRVILDAVGRDALRRLAEDTADLLDTSVAVYEKNGDYALGIFTSGWCQFMDAASRRRCGDVDNRAALTCGRWLCHESCWHEASQPAIETGKPTDIACVGGIHLYAMPIFAGDEIVGAINFGYGDPPRDTRTLEDLAAAFDVSVAELETQARAYQTRPAYIISLAKKRLHTIAALIGEIVERKRAEAALRESEEKLRRIVENSTELFYSHTPEHILTYLSPQTRTLLDCEPEEALIRWTELATDNPVNEVGFTLTKKAIATGEAQRPYELELVGKRGRKIWVEVRESPVVEDGQTVAIVGSLTDITTRKQMEAELQAYTNHLEQMVEEKVAELEREHAKTLQMDKMATIGQMATGVAHELNQPLTAITLDADYLKTAAQKLKVDPAARPELLTPDELITIGGNLIDDVARCRRIVDHLRTFGRVSTGPLTPISLEQPISDSLILTTARLREHDIDVCLNFAEDLPPILADSHKLEQVFLNLIANAEYAMEKRGNEDSQPRVLEITTYGESDYVIATVRDTGCGIPEAVRAHLFEPFYTTKPEGEGTGLGLAISYDIVTEFEGDITCKSTVGAGTTFTLQFPVAGSCLHNT